MHIYDLTCYFKNISEVHYFIYKQLEGIREAKKYAVGEDIPKEDDIRFWEEQQQRTIRQIVETVEKIEEKERIIITTKSEVIALLCSFEPGRIKNFRFFNAVEYFPEDDFSQKFLTAYKNKDEEELRNIRDRIVCGG